jgi:dUTP pyrophosphatase
MRDFRMQVVNGGEIPRLAHPGDAGFDLVANEDYVLRPMEHRAIGVGIRISIPAGYVALIHPRSGLALKEGISIINTPGTVDSGYRGEVKVALINLSTEPYQVTRGLRIAQLVIQRVETPEWKIVDELEVSERGEGGFGSTGGYTGEN